MTEEELGWYKKFNVPPHPWAPIPRLKYLLGFPEGIAIWKKPHARTGEPILSFVHPDSPYQVLPDREWHNTEFAQTERELDPAKPFFDQFRSLVQTVPVGALRDEGSSVNCVGVDLIKCQDTYMAFGAAHLKRIQYGSVSYDEQDSMCVTNTNSTNESFHMNATEAMHNCRYCFQCGECMNSAFLFDCTRCQDCFGASNKRNKRFLFWNEQLSEEEYKKRVSQIDLRSHKTWEEMGGRFRKMIEEESFFRPRWNFHNDEESEGEYLLRSTRCKECYWLNKSTDLFQCWVSLEDRESMSTVWLGWGDQAYLCVDVAYYHNMRFCMRTWRCQNLEYCTDCYDCEFCFGCAGLKKKKFHIFNKPYAEEEYWRRVDEIKCAMLDRGEYGMFFPADFSQPSFSFSMGEFFIGYSEEELKRFGAPSFDATKGNVYGGAGVLRATELPDHLGDTDPEKHVGKPILDEKLGRMYTITPAEFDFYKKKGLPLPREHFLSRLLFLMRHSNGPVPEVTSCATCHEEVVTRRNVLFSGRRRVLCMKCYLAYLEEKG